MLFLVSALLLTCACSNSDILHQHSFNPNLLSQHKNELNRLFHCKSQLLLMKGKVKEARVTELSEGFDDARASYPDYRKRLKEIYDHERLTEESYARKRFKTIEEAHQAVDEWIDNDKAQNEDKDSQNLDMMCSTVKMDWLSRKNLLNRYPKWFLQKQYWRRDPFELDLAKLIMKKHGEGQTIVVLDIFGPTLPDRLLSKCVNPERFKKQPIGRNELSHGVSIASIAVDTEFGVAPMANFKARTFHDIFPRQQGPGISYMNDSVQADVRGLDYTVLAGIDRFLARGDDVIEIEFAASGNYYQIQVPDLSEFNDAIVNLSVQYMDSIGGMRIEETEHRMVRLTSFASLVMQIIRRGAVILWASGNNSLILSDSVAYSVLKALSLYKPRSFINVLALDEDLTSIAPLSNQPGNHPLQYSTVAGPGTNVLMLDGNGRVIRRSGTSAAAPFIAGIIALFKSNLPGLRNDQILRALLDTASPVVIRYSQSRMQNIPVILTGVESRSLVPSHSYFYKSTADGTQKDIFVTQDMINQGRAKYGVGIINVLRAYFYLAVGVKPVRKQ